jgi:hypothetical protein
MNVSGRHHFSSPSVLLHCAFSCIILLQPSRMSVVAADLLTALTMGMCDDLRAFSGPGQRGSWP